MNAEQMLRCLREKVSNEIGIEEAGVDRFIVSVPFTFDDGDHFAITLHRQNGGWYFSDEGHTFMHLSYSDVDFSRGSRAKFVDETINAHGIQNHGGELLLPVADEAFGDVLFTYLQGLSRLVTVTDWTKSRVKSTFWEDFQALLMRYVPEDLRLFRYHDPQIDPQGNYTVDCFIPAPKRTWHVYAVSGDDTCRDATISIMHYERGGRRFGSLALHNDQASLNRRAVAQLSDVVNKQFSSLSDSERIAAFLREDVLEAA